MGNTMQDSETGQCQPGAGRAHSGTFQTTIKLDPSCRLIPQLSADAFRNIQGVYEVHVDATRKTIRIIFDGMQDTVSRLANYLCSCERNHHKPSKQHVLHFDFK